MRNILFGLVFGFLIGSTWNRILDQTVIKSDKNAMAWIYYNGCLEKNTGVMDGDFMKCHNYAVAAIKGLCN